MNLPVFPAIGLVLESVTLQCWIPVTKCSGLTFPTNSTLAYPITKSMMKNTQELDVLRTDQK